MLNFTFNVRELERFNRGLLRFAAEVPEIGASEIVRQVREFAASGRNPNGSAWPELSAAYAKRKAKMGLPAKPNKRVTGAFLASVKSRALFVSVDDQHAPIAEGLETLRISFQVAPISAGNVERLLLKRFEAI